MVENVHPVRLHLSRMRGFELQRHSLAVNGLPAVNVARPSKWGNPFVVGQSGGVWTARVMSRRHAWQLFEGMAHADEAKMETVRAELRGKNLACWCHLPFEPYEQDCCHAAVLLEIANAT